MRRRTFLRNTSLAAAGLTIPGFPAIAGPFSPADFRAPGHVPLDKKLDPAWIQSLFDRGKPTVYAKSRNELRYIGMPCGGIGCGTVYAGGDGRLWLWDIFNDNRNGIDPKTIEWYRPLHVGATVRAQDGANYVKPPNSDEKRPIEQGFALRISQGRKKTQIRRLHQDDWKEVTFEATYPIATIRYADPACPVQNGREKFMGNHPTFHAQSRRHVQNISVEAV
ncbi:MAG: hypothetical protein JNJ57_19630 [Saprospiraceae bacterium]|nr:hypothetical protein [Saprospiraceae bacterium]